MRAAIEGVLGDVVYLPELADGERCDALSAADAVLAWLIPNELHEDELELLGSAGLLQLLSAGADRVPFDQLPPDLPVASNAGAYSEPMAEHVVAMALALAKRLPQNQAGMRRGEFDQDTPTLTIDGAIVGILGFGGIGQASARLFARLGARVHALNRSGQTDAPVDWVGTLDELDVLLAAANIAVISLPLTRASRGLITRRELELMKPDGILVNVARAAIVDEDDLYEHLRTQPSFSAGIDTWWQEPREGEEFKARHPYLDLPNVIGSPHNSGITEGALAEAARQAAENVARHLRGEQPANLVDPSEY